MSAPYPTQQQPPYPPAQQPAAYPPPPNYGSAYPPPQEPYPVPVESYPAAPPPTYDSATQPTAPQAQYGGFQPMPQTTQWPKQQAADVEYGGQQPFDYDMGGIISFSDKSIRRAFIRKVYAILTLQLLVTLGFICLFIFHEGVKSYVQNHRALYFASFGVFFVFYFILICCDSVARKWPLNIIFLAIFTIALSYMVGTISSYHKTNIVLVMIGITAMVCMSVMIFSCQTKYDFTTWGGVLFVCAICLFFFGIFFPIWQALDTTVGKIFIGGALALLFVAFLAYDTQLVMGGKKYELSPEEYIFGSLILYMDIVRIFLLLLALFGRGD